MPSDVNFSTEKILQSVSIILDNTNSILECCRIIQSQQAVFKATLSSDFNKLFSQGIKIMATLQDVQNAVTAETTVVASAVTLLQQLSQMLKGALAANDPAAVQAVVDQMDAATQQLADAVAANTPAPPPGP